ncbi:glyoxalase/bleomycin resistance protein/dioxygenase superfamily protein (plasmid) [Novosphingobium sp. PP1Y]|nr:glyoxalase/bleomycin resistance protein/dioxygenase superfamily protein [Novosphingobium sp. PP1Y]
MTKRVPRAIDQVAWIVDDLDAAIVRRLHADGTGPWTVFRNVEMAGTYLGRETKVTMDVGLAYAGDLQLELIAPTNSAPSPYRGKDGKARIGLHHVAYVVEQLEEAVAEARAAGLDPVFEAANAAVRVAYLQHPAEPGALTELIEGEGMRALMKQGIAEAANWGGTDPIREISAS